MTPEHSEFIAKLRERGPVYGRCKAYCEEMAVAFPELTLVAGHVDCDWGRRSHYWLTTRDGEIIDPTSGQFGWIMSYEPWVAGTECLVGKCMQCGSEIWEPVDDLAVQRAVYVCSPACESALGESMR